MTLLAADSWLVGDGRTRAVDRHWSRFEATCREHGVAPEALAALRPDLDRLAALRERAAAHGAGEALLCDADCLSDSTSGVRSRTSGARL